MNINTKSNFLEKKKQQRKKTQEQIQIKSKLLILQKNIRAFMIRKKIKDKAIEDRNVSAIIMMASDISIFDYNTVRKYITNIDRQPEEKRSIKLKKIVLSCLRTKQTILLEEALRIVKENHTKLQSLFRDRTFAQLIATLLKEGKGFQFLNLAWKKLKGGPHLNVISNRLLFETVLSPFMKNKMQAQGIQQNRLSMGISLNIMDYVNKDKSLDIKMTFQYYQAIESLVLECLKQCSTNVLEQNVNGFTYLLDLLRKGLKYLFEQTTKQLIQQYKGFLSLIEDEEQMQYFENKMRSQPLFQDFCDQTLLKTQQIFSQSKILHFLMAKNDRFRQILTSYITQMNFIYDDRRIMFIYNFLSNEASLKEMSKQKKLEFYSALSMRLITMDDQDFKNDTLFEIEQWRRIIQSAITKTFEITRKMVMGGAKKEISNVKARIFQKGNENETQLKILSNVLNNLYKKCLRTAKFPTQFFINTELDKTLNNFKFGTGARTYELMLKNTPFVFRFESRLNKLKQFIKADKLNHDRSLFLQEEVDPDLIIEVRRGHEFLDAFDACFYKDLRKKYKIVFFNEQGLEEEGLDGGGIIKQFINRVLKSSFSEIYGMFYETDQNEILPNPYSPMTKEYEFVGKLVGKAVYEGINIQQKFAEPFLNLLIGRQNTFQDLQFIDQQIYKSMLNIRRMSNQDLQALQQTFTILDTTPFGQKRYVNLKHLSGNQIAGSETVVNGENKVQFVMAYSDYKCNKQLEEKTRLFRKGFLTVMKSEWLTMFSNQELNSIISGSNPNYSIIELKNSVVYKDYHEKSQTIIDLWSVLSEFTPEQKSAFLFFVTSCSRPPTMGFAAMKPLICIHRSNQISYLPTANTCMNVLRLPDYKNKQVLRQKLLYAINAKAGFQFA